MVIKVQPFLIKAGVKVGKAAIEFNDGLLKGFHLVGFTICDDPEKGLFVMFPASMSRNMPDGTVKPFHFLRAGHELVTQLEDAILDVYESMLGKGEAK